MKKITLLITILLCVGYVNAQTIADFTTASAYEVGGWGFSELPALADDGTGNIALKVVKDDDTTFKQGVTIIFNSPVTIDAGNTRLVAKIKGVIGARGYAKIYQNGMETFNNWWSKEDGSTIATDTAYEEFVLDGISGDPIDSMYIHIGGWDNGNAPAGLQGTYYIDDITAIAPPAVIVLPRKVIEIGKASGDITIDGLPLDDDWKNAIAYEIANYDSSSYTGTYKARFKALWSADYLLVLMEAEDATATEYDGDVDTWKRDGLQVYLDVRNKLLLGRKDNATQHQINLGYGNSFLTGWQGDIVDSIYNNSKNSMKTEWKSQAKTGGYFIEAKLPWAAMYYDGVTVDTWDKSVAAVSVEMGDTIGFDAQANDYNSTSDKREFVATWSSNSGDKPGGYQNSGTWGGLKLVKSSGIRTISTAALLNVHVYPNPAKEEITIEMIGMKSISIIDITGRQVIYKVVNADFSPLIINNLASGTYFIQISSEAGEVTKKLQVK